MADTRKKIEMNSSSRLISREPHRQHGKLDCIDRKACKTKTAVRTDQLAHVLPENGEGKQNIAIQENLNDAILSLVKVRCEKASSEAMERMKNGNAAGLEGIWIELSPKRYNGSQTSCLHALK